MAQVVQASFGILWAQHQDGSSTLVCEFEPPSFSPRMFYLRVPEVPATDFERRLRQAVFAGSPGGRRFDFLVDQDGGSLTILDLVNVGERDELSATFTDRFDDEGPHFHWESHDHFAEAFDQRFASTSIA